ncbi:MAG: beta-glucosidase [Parcubacteria group bacterium Gr01-1014_70]|nr:MAG: beta-glucosidase [Parcubacteria group bacterium Gr01-1014_70]
MFFCYNTHMKNFFWGASRSSKTSEARPDKFLFGAATSGHQVEGGTHNDWSEWEVENAKIKMQNAKLRRYPDYILQKYPNPLQEENYISGKACDHYNRYEEDFDIAKKLGHNAHRFSIEWSRIEPEEGKFDEKEIEHYRLVVSALRERGMEPFVTLWHWTLPVWLSAKGGVLAKDFPICFEKYARCVASALPDARFWITLNEPEIYVFNSYYRSIWPPQKKSVVSFFRATYALNVAHQRAYRVIKNNISDASVGVAVNQSYFESGGGMVNDILKWGADRVWNWRFLWYVSGELDFIGLNYYFHNRIDYGFNKNKNEKISDMGWELYPEGLYHVLLGLKQFQKPIYITENGLADAKDQHRAWFIREHVHYMKKAMDQGADVRGYFYWSLLDNFEWDKGFWPRFGLVEIDYKTMERKIHPSAWEYKKIIEGG